SITRWSQLIVSDMRWPTTIWSQSSITGTFVILPTARMKPCGGLMTAEKLSIPVPPRFETVNVPPWNSSGFIRLLRARCAKSFASGLQFFARFHEGPRIDIDCEIKMRNRTETFGEPLRNDFAHSGKLNARAFTSSN